MSMEVQLIRLGEDLLKAVRKAPNLIDDLIFEDDADPQPGFDPVNDNWSGSYRHFFVPYFEHVASEAGDDPDDFESSDVVLEDPFYRAMNGAEELDYEFCYGPASVHSPEAVKALVEEWKADFTKKDRDDSERLDVSLFLFYDGAAKANQGVVCGVS